MQHTDTAPSPVPAVAKPEGDTPAPHRWAWVEASIWTERMLAALDNGVQGGRWYSLMDKVASPRTLAAAWKRVAANKGAAGVDGISITRFQARAPYYLAEVERGTAGRELSAPARQARAYPERAGENPAPGDCSGQRSHRADGDHHGRGAHL